MTHRVLIVLTSHNQLGRTGKPTGYWKEEFSTPYYGLLDAGIEVTLASPKGGEVPVDPASEHPDAATDSTHRLDADPTTRERLGNTIPLNQIDAERFDAVLYPGGHGPLWDLVADEDSIRLLEAFWRQRKPVAAVCHGSIALIDARGEDGDYLVRDREVTGFSNSEERAIGLEEVVPWSVEDTLNARGARYVKASDFEAFATADGNLITGQNPASSGKVVERLLEVLRSS